MADIKQYIVLRKDAPTKTGETVSAAKLAVMTSHASMAFLSDKVRKNSYQKVYPGKDEAWQVTFGLDEETMEWIQGSFVKILLEAKNLHALERVVADAVAAGLAEGVDFFCIRDNCLTELVPDEGCATCFVAVGFRPMAASKLLPVVKRLQVYHNRKGCGNDG